jgi:hypothetical protein
LTTLRSRLAGVLVVVAVGPIAAMACGGDATGVGAKTPTTASTTAASAAGPTASAATSASSLPAATAIATAAPPTAANDSPATKWIKAVPSRPVTARVDELVWAAVPTDTDVRLGIYRVVAVSGATAALQDLLRVRWEKVPGALVFPVGDPTRVRVDMLVTYADWRGFVGVGQIVKTQPKIRVTFRDASAVVREETVNVAEPLAATIDRLQWVAFPKPGDDSALHKGLVFAIDGDNVFVRDETNHAWVVERARVTPLKFPAKRLKVGDAVRAYSSEKGYRAGVVAKVFLPGLSYGVTADDETRIYFFSDLALAP